jgi:hypothetical protein
MLLVFFSFGADSGSDYFFPEPIESAMSVSDVIIASW